MGFSVLIRFDTLAVNVSLAHVKDLDSLSMYVCLVDHSILGSCKASLHCIVKESGIQQEV